MPLCYTLTRIAVCHSNVGRYDWALGKSVKCFPGNLNFFEARPVTHVFSTAPVADILGGGGIRARVSGFRSLTSRHSLIAGVLFHLLRLHRRAFVHMLQHTREVFVAEKYVAYYRVSTTRQGRSGLGLDSQKHAVREYLSGRRGRHIAEHVEIESGRNNARPQLQLALAACRVHGATLIVAKLDRLSRNAAFLLTLRDSAVEFVAADMPDANRLTVGILAMIAEHEAEAISARTKAALAAAKRRGVRLGNPAHLDKKGARARGTTASALIRAARSQQRAADLSPSIAALRAAGATSLRSLARGLNSEAIPAPRGGAWTAPQVQRMLSRIEA
jgi:DNA invertase Pin-like site-specific DNA recombinase